MLDNGYSLAKIELLNWGNFHGYYRLPIYDMSADGLLFSRSSTSAVFGINGSGKSTLIDALMIALLPFEGSLKLGVTNDIEGGSSGGRTIRDYVLGKHSSNYGSTNKPEDTYGRKEGCSFVLLQFAHNRKPQTLVTLGRGWWYQNYKVSESQIAFLAFENVSLSDLFHEGKTPPSQKAFRQNLKTSRFRIQTFETLQSYFTSLSQALGGISRDDLKILNRAFFVKSISNIDLFIRENMLIEQDSPNLDRLMDIVRSGHEIAFSIETCEAKISAITKILKDLAKLQTLVISAQDVDLNLRLLSLHREWSDLQDLLKQQADLKNSLQQLHSQLPLLKNAAATAADQLRAAESRLLSDDLEGRLSAIDQEIKILQEKISWKTTQSKLWYKQADALALSLPRTASTWRKWFEALPTTLETLRHQRLTVLKQIEEFREKKFTIEAESRSLRQELDHFGQNRTLIPFDLYEIKERAIKDLKMPATHLMFVGELLQVKRQQSSHRRAIESVLFPISRNLLCHPDDLQKFTRWLDAEGLRADVTVKRITDGELITSSDESVTETKESNKILSMLELRSKNEHPFYNYVERWLKDVFDFSIVDVAKFRTENSKVVTEAGLVKNDPRTMRKLKARFADSLGWNNTEAIERLTKDLLALNQHQSELTRKLTEATARVEKSEDQERLLTAIRDGHEAILDFENDQQRVTQLESEKSVLLQKNPDHQKLREQVHRLQTESSGLAKSLLKIESELQGQQHLLTKVESLIPGKQDDISKSKLYLDLCQRLEGSQQLETNLLNLDSELKTQAKTRLQREGELKDQAQQIEVQRHRTAMTAVQNLTNYRNQFNDPDLPYDLGRDLEFEKFLNDWKKAEARLVQTELPTAQEKWRKFFDQVLLDAVKNMINEIKSRLHEVEETIQSINQVLKLTNFEDLIQEQRYLNIHVEAADDERIRKFRRRMVEVEKTLSPVMRAQVEQQSQAIMTVLNQFVEDFQKDPGYRAFATDVRNHFQFSVRSVRRAQAEGESDQVVEAFSGARKDAKSSAQTTQLAYALLASCLAYRFHFHDPVAGADTPRLIILDEFGGKFDNEKPKEIVKLLDKMGFQSLLISPMSKADLLAEYLNHFVLVHKVSASQSKARSYRLNSREDYQQLINMAAASP